MTLEMHLTLRSTSLQRDMDEVVRWSNENKMILNGSKTKCMMVTGKRLAKNMEEDQFTFITRRPFWSPWGIKALSLHCLCPSSLTLNERFDGQNLLFGH